jgi:glycosyltransferase involved in cell wall biosynthesis
VKRQRSGGKMHITIVTDAWKPQVNGVVRTLERLQFEAAKLGIHISFVTPEKFPTLPMPGYPEIRLSVALPAQLHAAIEEQQPDWLHIATEGPLGIMARHYALKKHRKFTTCYHTAYPQYLSARYPIPEGVTYACLRHFHNASSTTMVATEPLRAALKDRGFERLAIWSRGVDAELYRPREKSYDIGPGPQLLYVGRVAIEKNLAAFLAAPSAGTKIIVGDGPDRAKLQSAYPDAVFLGVKTGEELAKIYASADLFVFPSLTDTFGLVLLEALASGVPVAAFPAGGFLDTVAEAGVGILHSDLSVAIEKALTLSRKKAREFAMGYTHQASARQFIRNIEAA